MSYTALKLKNFCSVKDYMKGMTRQGTNWGKIFVSYISDKGLVSRRTLKTTVKKKNQTSQLESGQKTLH